MRRAWASGRAVRMMRDSGTIVRIALLDDGRGGTYDDPAGPEEIGPVLGMFWALSGAEVVRAEQLGELGRYRYAVPLATDIRVTDQVVVLGRTYNVVWAPPAAALDVERIVGLEESGETATLSSGSTSHGLLTEDGGGILTEDGDFIILEAGAATGAILLELGGYLLTEDGDHLRIEA